MTTYGPRIDSAAPQDDCFNTEAILPYSLRIEDFRLAMLDVYDLLHDINQALLTRGVGRFEETVNAFAFSGMLSDMLPASLASHSRGLTENQLPNGHPDLIPKSADPESGARVGDAGVEVKVTQGSGLSIPMRGREGWLLIFRYRIDSETETAISLRPTRFVEVLLAELERGDFVGRLDTRPARLNRSGKEKLRSNWIYRDPPDH